MNIKRKAQAEIRDERVVKKLLPYSVTPIGDKGDLRKWKADQARKESEWQAKKAAEYAIKRDALASVVVSGGLKALAGDNYESPAAKFIREAREGKTAKAPAKVEPKQQKAESKSALDKALDFFINTNFQPKDK